MGDGTKENPFTREDVVRLIEDNGGKARGLNLSGKAFEDKINLRQLNLEGIVLSNATLKYAHFELTSLHSAILNFASIEAANFNDAGLKGANLASADLFSADFSGAYCESSDFNGANLINANFTKANLRNVCFDNANLMLGKLESAILTGAHLDETNFMGTHFSDNYLFDIQISNETKLEDADWGDYVIREEKEKDTSAKSYSLHLAESTYRRLKIWYSEHGIYDVAGKFFYREMEARRKIQKWRQKPHLKLWDWIMRLLCGYGEKPERVVISAVALILLCTLICFGFNSWSAFGHSLYFSAVSFTAVGYGGWVDNNWMNISNNWIKGTGVTESFFGVFMMALFLVTFIRKMTR